jgi:hypothetical protein
MDGEGSVQIAGSVEKIEIETLERENSRKEERDSCIIKKDSKNFIDMSVLYRKKYNNSF